MKKIILLIIILIASCKKETAFEKNFDTPQGAVLCLEDAYRSKDIDKILDCKDFKLEAIYMLRYQIENMADSLKLDEEIINELAEILKHGFVAEIKNNMPNFDDVDKSEFTKIKKIDDDFVLLEEICTFKDGSRSKDNLIVGKKGSEWRMATVLIGADPEK
jgi:hypothetical protein